jgi:alpha-L-fucosidase
MFIHLAPQTWEGTESDDLSVTPDQMNPEKLDTDQWASVAESMGAKYIVFVAKHEGGFCWWQTDTTDFSVKSTPWRGGKGDVLADLSKSCATKGMKLGVYISPQDRKHGVGVGGKAKTPEEQAAYEKLFRTQLTEVLSRYGPMMEVWFDGSLLFDVGDILKEHAPRAVVFQGPQASIRWVGNEDGVCPYPAWNTVNEAGGANKWGEYTAAESDAAGDRWLPIECDARMRATWFWNPHGEVSLKSVDRLMDMYEQSVGHGATLLLNSTPDTTGLIPVADAARAAEFGAAIARRYGKPLAEASGIGRTLSLRCGLSINRVVIMEDIEGGERIRDYVIEGLDASQGWKPLAGGNAIGHKKIDTFGAGPIREIRLRVLDSVGEPKIRRFAAYGDGTRY